MLHLESGSGVCLVNGASEPGRRRATVAHELGHFLFDDEYSSDVMGGSSRDRQERLIDVFAGSFLLPEPALRKEWLALGGSEDPRSAGVNIASEYRVSWGLVLTRLAACGLIDADVRRLLRPTPTKADFLARKVAPPPPDLEPPSVSPAIGEAVMAAYSSDLITGERALELLHEVVDELPPRGLLPKHLLKEEFSVA